MKATKATHESVLPSEMLIEHLITAVALIDADLRFVQTNAAFCELFDVGASRLRGLTLEAFGPASAVLLPLAQRVRAEQNAVAQRGHPLTVAPGRKLHVDIIASPAPDAGILIEIHRLTPELPAAPSRLSESLRGLAHEVKNPLAGVRGAAQLLLRRVVEPDLRKLAALIIAEADRLAALTDRLLHPGGKPHLGVVHPAEVNLHEIAEHARALIAAEAAAPDLKLDRDYDPSLPSLRGDADRLLQLLLNLMRNAVQAKAKSIVVRTRAEHAAVIDSQPVRLAARLDVIDDGIGVPENLHDTLFLPLVSGRAEGTGLGLALAQEIAHEHGGQIGCSSRPGLTTFSLLLPLEHAHAGQAHAEQAHG
ncbi:MAG: nitrogen regulation protein NR(II) [Rudaea sp.]|nr:nitrogen regulation protein NR(II) [Rudaea sp.]